MKKRMKKKMVKTKEKRIRAQIHEILDLVLDINGVESRKQDTTGNKPTAFMGFSGHVALVNVEVCENGWSGNGSVEFKDSRFIDYECLNSMIANLKKEKEKLCIR